MPAELRSDYAEAVERLQRIARALTHKQVDEYAVVKALVDQARQALQTIACCSDPAVLAAADTERPDPPLEALKSDTAPLLSGERDNREDSWR